jgi:hypothetical protein
MAADVSRTHGEEVALTDHSEHPESFDYTAGLGICAGMGAL